MNYCEGCRIKEGDTKEDEEGNLECAECGELIVFLPENDDWDMDR